MEAPADRPAFRRTAGSMRASALPPGVFHSCVVESASSWGTKIVDNLVNSRCNSLLPYYVYICLAVAAFR